MNANNSHFLQQWAIKKQQITHNTSHIHQLYTASLGTEAAIKGGPGLNSAGRIKCV